ncbi:MAG: phosphatidate cytidylyltransferase [Rhodobacteraceae bacterium]|nr:phosphatidate cytidylyltransferase [Paracoccaceae bacterium]
MEDPVAPLPLPEPAPLPEPPAKFGDLLVRVVSAVVMALIGGIVFWKGGVFVVGLLVVVGSLMAWEYRRLILPDAKISDKGLWVMVAGIIGAVISANLFGFALSLLPVILAAVILFQIKNKRPIWLAAGMLYLAVPLAALVVVRQVEGLGPVLWLVGVVIASDVGGYFAGRVLGGPKLWSAVSPKKTWSGTLGGWVLAVGVGFIYWLFGGEIFFFSALLFSVVLVIAAQAGDLLESWLKRKAGIKDSSRLIPGHGGLLDRFDGLLAATSVYMILHLFRVL